MRGGDKDGWSAGVDGGGHTGSDVWGSPLGSTCPGKCRMNTSARLPSCSPRITSLTRGWLRTLQPHLPVASFWGTCPSRNPRLGSRAVYQ